MKYLKRLFVQAMVVGLMLLTAGCSKQNNLEDSSNTSVKSTMISRPKILDMAIETDETYILSYIPNDSIEENLAQEISIFKNQLLCSCFVYDPTLDSEILHLKLLSLDSGQLLHEEQIQIAGSYTTVVQALDDCIVVSDAQNNSIQILDESLKPVKSYTASGNLIYVNSNTTEAYCLTSNDGIHIVNLDSKQERILLEHTQDLCFYSCWGNNICVRYIDLNTQSKKECYAQINLDTGELVILDPDSSHLSMKLSGTVNHLVESKTDTNDNQSMTVYDSNGKFLSSCSLENISGTPPQKLLWHEGANGFFFIVIDDNGYDKLYFWDLSKAVDGTDLNLSTDLEDIYSTGTVLEQKYYELAQTLSKKYNLTIKIADLCSSDYSDKIVQLEYDTSTITSALDTLEKAFSNYPEGFFSQLYYGSYHTIEINLTGVISNKEYIEGYAPTAFVLHEDDKIIIVLNITVDPTTLETNLYHESSHVIDKFLEHNALYRSDALYSEETWSSMNSQEFMKLNPETNGYYNSYEMLPMEYYQDDFTPYFAADYGKTFPTEDRATIFETAMSGNTKLFSTDVSNPLRSKLQYYCKCIRDCFDTTGWPEYTSWEKPLQ